MGRLVMDRGMRRIKRTPAAEPVDPRLALVDLFMNGQEAPQGFVDLSQHDGANLSDLFIEDPQAPAEQPVADETENSLVEVSEAAHEEPAKPEPVVEASPRLDADDYDPIAAVLG
jgi:hypothetical protein